MPLSFTSLSTATTVMCGDGISQLEFYRTKDNCIYYRQQRPCMLPETRAKSPRICVVGVARLISSVWNKGIVFSSSWPPLSGVDNDLHSQRPEMRKKLRFDTKIFPEGHHAQPLAFVKERKPLL